MLSKEFFDVQIDVGSGIGVLSYYMTDDFEKMAAYVEKKYNIPPTVFKPFRNNPDLSKNVITEMISHECYFSVTDDNELVYVNLYDGVLPQMVAFCLDGRPTLYDWFW